MKTTRGQRLRSARVAAGFKSAAKAAEALGIRKSTYNAHERAEDPGGRDYGPDDAARYARKFRVDDTWLLTAKGRGPADVGAIDDIEPPDDFGPAENATDVTVPLVGWVSAGSQVNVHPTNETTLDYVLAPADSNDRTRALEIQGNSLGDLFDRWLVFFDDEHRPVSPDLLNRLCIVELTDGRVLVKKIRRRAGQYDLLSNTEPPIENVQIKWAARVKHMAPR